MRSTTDAISNGRARSVNNVRQNSTTPGVTAGAVIAAGTNDATAAQTATNTPSAMSPADHERSSERSASSRRRRVSITVNSTSTETSPA